MHLQEAETLVGQKLHPQTIIAGWRRAVAAADEALTQAAMDNRWVYEFVEKYKCGDLGPS